MKIKRELGTTAGLFLILMLASGTQAATAVPDKTDFTREAESSVFTVERVEGGYFKPGKADVEFEAPSNVPDATISVGEQIFGAFFSVFGLFKFQIDRSFFAAGVTDEGRGDSIFSISRLFDLSRFKLKVSDESVATVALLILVGLVAIIALKGRRK